MSSDEREMNMQCLEQRFSKTADGLVMRWVLKEGAPPRSEEQAADAPGPNQEECARLLPAREHPGDAADGADIARPDFRTYRQHPQRRDATTRKARSKIETVRSRDTGA
jgi:hypothetical protein